MSSGTYRTTIKALILKSQSDTEVVVIISKVTGVTISRLADDHQISIISQNRLAIKAA